MNVKLVTRYKIIAVLCVLLVAVLAVIWGVNHSRLQNSKKILVTLSAKLETLSDSNERDISLRSALEELKKNTPIRLSYNFSSARSPHYHMHGNPCDDIYREIGWTLDAYNATGDEKYLDQVLFALNEYMSGCYSYS